MERIDEAKAALKAMRERHRLEAEPLLKEIDRLRVRRNRGLSDNTLDEQLKYEHVIEDEAARIADLYPE